MSITAQLERISTDKRQAAQATYLRLVHVAAQHKAGELNAGDTTDMADAVELLGNAAQVERDIQAIRTLRELETEQRQDWPKKIADAQELSAAAQKKAKADALAFCLGALEGASIDELGYFAQEVLMKPMFCPWRLHGSSGIPWPDDSCGAARCADDSLKFAEGRPLSIDIAIEQWRFRNKHLLPVAGK